MELICTLAKRWFPTVMAPHVSLDIFSHPDNESQLIICLLCQCSQFSLLFHAPALNMGLRIRAMHRSSLCPVSCTGPYVPNSRADCQSCTEQSMLTVGGWRSWENWGGSQGSRKKESQMWEGILAEIKGGLLSKACTGSRRTELAICYAENLWVCL